MTEKMTAKVTGDANPEITAEATGDANPEITAEATGDANPEIAAEVTGDANPEITAENDVESDSELKNIVEAALLAAQRPMSLRRLSKLFEASAAPPGLDRLRALLRELQGEYAGRGIELKEVASGFRFQVRSCYARWVNRVWDERPPRYSRALLETLSIIAYRQPVTRGEIEAIRGIAVNPNIIRTLAEREWIRSVGHREVPGRPELLATTRQFLDYFNLKKLSDLPTLQELKGAETLDLFQNPPALEAESTEESGESDHRQGQNLPLPTLSTDEVSVPEELPVESSEENASEEHVPEAPIPG